MALLKPETAAIDQALKDDLKTVNNRQLAEVLEYAVFNGGKRIRPLLCLLAHRMSSEHQRDQHTLDRKNLYNLAISFEYLHVASLLHDDVIDHAHTRRGKDTANKVWGTTPVILAGDYLHSRAMSLANQSGSSAILSALSDSTAAMVESEFVQMESVKNQDKTEKSYFRVLQGKTAALIAAACRTGALFSAADASHSEALKLFGNNLGLAFQITDDILDYLGNPEKTGKAVGNDFVEAKMTLPLIFALKNSSDTEQEKINNLLVAPAEKRAAELDTVRNIIERSGGFAYSRTKAETLIKEAVNGLDLFNNTQEKAILESLSKYVLLRDK